MHYVFEMDEVLSLEADVELLHSMCLDAVDNVVTTERYRDFGIPEWVWPAHRRVVEAAGPARLRPVRPALRRQSGPAKLLEYNADTPTSLLEASIIQWYWKTDVFPDDDQWNSIHEKLVERWTEIGDKLPSNELHFTWSARDAYRRGPRHRRPTCRRPRPRAGWTRSAWPSRTSAGTGCSSGSSTSKRRR